MCFHPQNKENIGSNNRHVYFTKAGQQLDILRASLEDAGIYECVSYAEKNFFNVSIQRIQRVKRVDQAESNPRCLVFVLRKFK